MATGDRHSSRDVRAIARAAAMPAVGFRGINTTISADIYKKGKAAYDTLQYLSGRNKSVGIDASLILISGCQDHQLSGDGEANGMFTGALLEVWNNGGFTGDYKSFWNQVVSQLPPTQTPNFFTLGDVSTFAAERPFTVATQQFNANSSINPRITVVGSSSRSRTDGAPNFTIDTQGAPYYVTEFATDISLFAGGDRTSSNFWGSWSESPMYSSDFTFYPLPNSVWDALKQADKIYFRVGTATSFTGYENYRVSTQDEDFDGPSLAIID